MMTKYEPSWERKVVGEVIFIGFFEIQSLSPSFDCLIFFLLLFTA